MTQTRQAGPKRRDGIRLGISREVEAARRTETRLLLLADGAEAVCERVVLRRWRRRPRRNAHHSFEGFRLPPATWWVVNALLEQEPTRTGFDGAWIATRLDAIGADLRSRKWRAPAPESLAVLLTYLHRRGVLKAVLERHGTGRLKKPGIPDLFLFTRDRDGNVNGAKFVEVKVNDKLSKQQRAEITFLRNLGLTAGVVRLIIRKRRSAAV